MDDIDSIKQRNARVEADKAWETSWMRRLVITIGTYGIVGGYLNYLQVDQAWLHAFVPATAYLISTLSLRCLKTLWIEKIYKKEVS